MAFKNEYVLPIDQEQSEFFRQAQRTLNVLAEARSKWTIDRERNMVLLHEGRGRELEEANRDSWSFIDQASRYAISTEKIDQSEISSEELSIKYKVRNYWAGRGLSAPDAEALAHFKEALREYKDYGVVSDYKRCRLTLIDGATGREI